MENEKEEQRSPQNLKQWFKARGIPYVDAHDMGFKKDHDGPVDPKEAYESGECVEGDVS